MFTLNPELDVKKSNPCIEYEEKEVDAIKILLYDTEYYYTLEPFNVYLFDKKLNGYVEINNNEIKKEINSIIKKSK